MSKEKQAQAWAMWTEKLTSEARAALTYTEETALPTESSQAEADEDKDAYFRFRMRLSPDAREALDGNVDTTQTPDEDVDASVARYAIVESPDGEWAMARLYKTPEALAKRVGQLDGSDTVVWCFFGLPIQLTRGPQRYLILPGGNQAIAVPLVPGAPCKLVPADLLESLEIQEDGYLGPKELANTKLVLDKLEPTPLAGKKGDDEDDEDDELEDEASID